MRAEWRVEVLGGLRVRYREGAWLTLPPGKPGALLARLAVTPRPYSREELIELLWPECDPDAGRHNLRGILYALRRHLAAAGASVEEWLCAGRTTVTLLPARFSTDVADLHAALAAAAGAATQGERAGALARVLDLYRGELLPGFFEPWVLAEREHLGATFLEALRQLVQTREESGDLAGALAAAQQAVRADPLREEAHYDLMRLYAATGQPAACLRQYEELERLLREELRETPSAEARALAEELRRSARTLVVARRLAPLTDVAGRPPESPADWASGEGTPKLRDDPQPPRSAVGAVGDRLEASAARSAGGPTGGSAGTLPVQLTRFYGRQEEIARLTALLSPAVSRLVTVTGPGGSGKTRLAVAAVGRMVGASLNSTPAHQAVVFVALADVTDAARIPEAIADALGLDLSPEVEVVEQVIGYFAAQPCLLVLDNYEHLVEAGALWVRTLLERAPTLICLVTSRQRLGITGEQEFALLPLPTPRRGTTFEQLGEYASVQLFVDRARAVRSDFALTAENAAAVAELCDRLDGLPLALELAAARISVLSPQEMLGQLEQRFAFLVTRQRDTPARHRTLLAVIESSYQLLEAELQRFFARLSVFRGGCTLEAAEAVCGAAGVQGFGSSGGQGEAAVLPDPLKTRTPEPLALNFLEQLRDCSLLTVEVTQGEGRYRLLETVREYAGEKLAASGELTATRNRHRNWYLQLAELAEAEVLGPGRGPAWRSLEAELDNCRAALAWCREEADAHSSSDAADTLFRLTHALCLFFGSGHGHLTESLQWLEEALVRGSHLPAERRASALTRAAHVAYVRGDRDRSRTFCKAARGEYQTVLELARRDGDRRRVAWALLWLAEVTTEDHDDNAAWDLFVEARPLFEALNEPAGLIRTLNWLAVIALKRGDRGAARSMYDEQVAICRQWGDASRLFHALGGMGHLERDDGNYSRARALYQESLVLRRKAEDQTATAQSLEDLAVLAGREQQFERAIRLLGASEAFCETFGAQTPVAMAREYERTVAEGRAALGEAAFAAAWAAGRSMSLDQALEYALGAP